MVFLPRFAAAQPTDARCSVPMYNRVPGRVRRVTYTRVFAGLQGARRSHFPMLPHPGMARSTPQSDGPKSTPPLASPQLELRRPALHTSLPLSLPRAMAAQTDRRTRIHGSFPNVVFGRETSGSDTVSGSRPIVPHGQQRGTDSATRAPPVFQ